MGICADFFLFIHCRSALYNNAALQPCKDNKIDTKEAKNKYDLKYYGLFCTALYKITKIQKFTKLCFTRQ